MELYSRSGGFQAAVWLAGASESAAP